MSQSHGSNSSLLSQPIGLPLPAWMSVNVALLILMAVFFCIPFTLRAARLSLESMKNDVKDWLPQTFGETADLEWFREHFMGEQFILVSWPEATGMYYDDMTPEERANLEKEIGGGFQAITDIKFKLFIDKLHPEPPPSVVLARKKAAKKAAEAVAAKNAREAPEGEAPEAEKPTEPSYVDSKLHYYVRQLTLEDTAWREGFIGDELGLYVANVPKGQDPFFTNWGGENEKWIKGRGNVWYFIKPKPESPDEPTRLYGLYRWDGQSTLLGGFYRDILRRTMGTPVATGEEVAVLPAEDGEWYYSEPQRLSALWFKTVTTGPGALSRMLDATESSFQVTEEEARRRLQGSLFGIDFTLKDKDGNPLGPQVRQTCMILTLTDAAKKELGQTCGRGILGKPLGQLYRLADEIGLKPEEIKMGGPPIDNVAIDEEGQVTLVNLIWYSMAVGIGLTFFLLRSVYQTLMVFFVGGVSAVLAMAIVYWSHSSVDAILLTMPGLVYVLGISGTLHLLNYYKHTAHEEGVEGAPERAAKHTFWPAFLCCFTSSLGLFSLCTSEITPIYKFGLFAGIGTMATLILLFTYLPAALETWPTARPRQEEDDEAAEARVHPTWWQSLEQRYEKFMDEIPGGICDFLLANRTLVAIVCTVAAIVASAGVFQLKTEIQLLKMFAPDTKIIGDYAWLEKNLGKLVPMEVVFRIDPHQIAYEAPEKKAEGAEGAEAEEPVAGPAPVPAAAPQLTFEEQLVPHVLRPEFISAQERMKLNFLERLEYAEAMRRIIETEFGPSGRGIAGNSMTASTFAPNTPSLTSRTRYAFNLRLVGQRHKLVATDYLCTEKKMEPEPGDGPWQLKWKLGVNDPNLSKVKYEPGKAELWRISLRLGALNNVDYGFFVGQLKSGVEPAMAAYEQRTKILTRFARETADGSFEKKKVLLIGQRLARPKSEAPATTAPAAGEAEANKTDAEDAAVAAAPVSQQELTRPLDAEEQTRIFAGRLRPLLITRQIKVKEVDLAGKDAPSADDLAALIADHDCVVILGEIPADAAQRIVQQSGTKLHDCRAEDIIFHPADTQSGFSDTSRQRGAELHAVYTGVVPVVYKAQRTLLNSLNESFIWSLLTITPTMMLILVPGRTFVEKLHPTNIFFGACGGFIAMLPNVFPIAMVFGVMGYLGIVIDLGTMMTASVAIGIAVDDTIHYLNYFRDGLNAGMSKEDAIREGYKRCALSFIQTALICGLGLGVFAFSSFTPTQRFGSMMVVLLITAVFGDLLFLPALLAGPFGWFFRPDPAGLEEHPEKDAKAADEKAELETKKLIAESPVSTMLRDAVGLPENEVRPLEPKPAEPTAKKDDAPSGKNGDGENGSGKPTTKHSPLRTTESGRVVRHDRPHEGTP